jgi:hypothetical protein
MNLTYDEYFSDEIDVSDFSQDDKMIFSLIQLISNSFFHLDASESD